MSRSKSDKQTLLMMLLVAIIVVLLIIILALALKKQKPKTDNSPKVQPTVLAENDYIAFLDVGQGDGALLKSGDTSAIIDNGRPEGAAAFCEKLKNLGVSNIKTMLLTHNHDDHMGGSEAVSNAFDINNLILPDLSKTGSPTRILGTVSNTVSSAGGNVQTAKSGMFYDIGNIKMTVLCCYYQNSNENERSIITLAELGGKRFLFTGDAGKQAENQMIIDGIDFDCDVLKAGNHGSRGASSAQFLALCTPEYAVISCGAGNQYKHPHEEALSRLINAGAEILRTDQSGDITFYVLESILKYKTQK